MNYTRPYFPNDPKAMFDMLIGDLGATMFRVVPYLVYSNWEETSGPKDGEYWNDRIEIELPPAAAGPASWGLYETTRELDCRKVNTIPSRDGHAEIELPGEAVFTLIGRPGKAD